jgi:uncharacterized membrane protein
VIGSAFARRLWPAFTRRDRASAHRPLFAAAAVLWAVMLPTAAYAASQPAGSGLWHPFALAVYGLGSAICHQHADRSFHLFAAQLPVCARCTGIYLGAAIAAVAYVVSGFSRTRVTVRLKADTTYVRVILAVAALPALLTLAYEWTTGDVPSNWVRAASGVVLGVGVSVAILNELRQPDAGPPKPSGSSPASL